MSIIVEPLSRYNNTSTIENSFCKRVTITASEGKTFVLEMNWYSELKYNCRNYINETLRGWG